jgi:hypothetical protein
MTEAKEKIARRHLDAYYTSQAQVVSLINSVDIHGAVLEPAAGKLAVARKIARSPRVKVVVTNDIDPDMPTTFHGDATNYDHPMWRSRLRWDWLVTNPPYYCAAEILRIAWHVGITNIAMLLRLSFDEPTQGHGRHYGRAKLLQEMQPFHSHQLIFGSPRPSYTDDGKTDSVTTAWFVWEKDHLKNGKGCGTRKQYITDWQMDGHNGD